MANDIYTMTPGSAVADTLQQILQRKRDLARQDMLDKLASEEQSSVIAARQAATELGRTTEARQGRATDSDIAANQAQIANANENIFQSKLKNVPRGAKPKDEAMLGEMRNRGVMETAPMFGPPSEQQPEDSHFEGYAGTPEERDRDELHSYYDEAAAATDDPIMKAGINIMKAGGPAIPFYLGPQDTTIVDPDNPSKPTVLKGVRPGGVEVLPRRPQMPAGFQPQPYQVIDSSGNFVGNTSIADSDVGAWNAKNPGLQLRPVGWKPEAGKNTIGTADISILAGAYQTYQEAQSTADNSYGDFGRDLSGKAARARKTYERVVGGVAAKAKIDPNALEAANVIINDPELAAMDLKDAIQELDLGNVKELNMEDLQKALLLFGGSNKGQ